MQSLQNIVTVRPEQNRETPVIDVMPEDDDKSSRVTYKSSILTAKSVAFVPVR
jgi:hypothetical protein